MAIDFEDALARQGRRERLPKATRQLMDQVTQGGNFVDDIAAQIAAGRSDRAMQRQVNRAIGTGPWQGRTPFATRFDPSLVNPTGATPQSIVSQAPPLALGPGQAGGALQTAGGRIPTVPMQPGIGAGQPAIGPATVQNVGNIGYESGAAQRAASGGAGLADDALAISRGAGQAASSPIDDIVASAAGATGGSGGGVAAAGAGGASAAQRASMLANITKGSLIRGAGVAGAGYMASGILDSMDIGGENSAWDRAGSGAVLGAGLGMGGAIALGLGTGPVGWAALGGAALFGGAKYLWGDSETSVEKMQTTIDDTRENILQIGGMYGLDQNALNDILMQYDMSASLYLENEDKEGMKAWMAGLTQTLPAMMLQQKEEADRYGKMIALQGQFAPMFEAQMSRAAQASEVAMQSADQVAGYFEQDHPNLAALTRQVAAQSNESSQRLMAAYAQQIALSPAMNEQQYQQQMALQQATAYPVG